MICEKNMKVDIMSTEYRKLSAGNLQNEPNFSAHCVSHQLSRKSCSSKNRVFPVKVETSFLIEFPEHPDFKKDF